VTRLSLFRRSGYVPVSGLALTLEHWRHILNYKSHAGAATLTKLDSKQDRLRCLGVLNPLPERVRAPWFQSNDFFDARDLIQVKYEMLRHVSVDGASKADAAELFGVSRPTFYQAEAAFARDGLAGLMPKPRGPKGAHKLNLEAMAFVDRHLEGDGSIHARAPAEQLESELGISVHPRSCGATNWMRDAQQTR
jgi:transposase